MSKHQDALIPMPPLPGEVETKELFLRRLYLSSTMLQRKANHWHNFRCLGNTTVGDVARMLGPTACASCIERALETMLMEANSVYYCT